MVLSRASSVTSLSSVSSLHSSTTTTDTSATSTTDHPLYYLTDGNLKLQLDDGTIYNVHRYFFDAYSSRFAEECLSEVDLVDDEDFVIKVPDVSRQDFDRFLSLIYPSAIGVRDIHTADEWLSVLRLATRWSFDDLRALSLRELKPIALAVDRVVIARELGKPEWLLPALVDVCMAPKWLNLQDAERLEMPTVVEVGRIREEMRDAAEWDSEHVARALEGTGLCAGTSASEGEDELEYGEYEVEEEGPEIASSREEFVGATPITLGNDPPVGAEPDEAESVIKGHDEVDLRPPACLTPSLEPETTTSESAAEALGLDVPADTTLHEGTIFAKSVAEPNVSADPQTHPDVCLEADTPVEDNEALDPLTKAIEEHGAPAEEPSAPTKEPGAPADVVLPSTASTSITATISTLQEGPTAEEWTARSSSSTQMTTTSSKRSVTLSSSSPARSLAKSCGAVPAVEQTEALSVTKIMSPSSPTPLSMYPSTTKGSPPVRSAPSSTKSAPSSTKSLPSSTISASPSTKSSPSAAKPASSSTKSTSSSRHPIFAAIALLTGSSSSSTESRPRSSAQPPSQAHHKSQAQLKSQAQHISQAQFNALEAAPASRPVSVPQSSHPPAAIDSEKVYSGLADRQMEGAHAYKDLPRHHTGCLSRHHTGCSSRHLIECSSRGLILPTPPPHGRTPRRSMMFSSTDGSMMFSSSDDPFGVNDGAAPAVVDDGAAPTVVDDRAAPAKKVSTSKEDTRRSAVKEERGAATNKERGTAKATLASKAPKTAAPAAKPATTNAQASGSSHRPSSSSHRPSSTYRRSSTHSTAQRRPAHQDFDYWRVIDALECAQAFADSAFAPSGAAGGPAKETSVHPKAKGTSSKATGTSLKVKATSSKVKAISSDSKATSSKVDTTPAKQTTAMPLKTTAALARTTAPPSNAPAALPKPTAAPQTTLAYGSSAKSRNCNDIQASHSDERERAAGKLYEYNARPKSWGPDRYAEHATWSPTQALVDSSPRRRALGSKHEKGTSVKHEQAPSSKHEPASSSKHGSSSNSKHERSSGSEHDQRTRTSTRPSPDSLGSSGRFTIAQEEEMRKKLPLFARLLMNGVDPWPEDSEPSRKKQRRLSSRSKRSRSSVK